MPSFNSHVFLSPHNCYRNRDELSYHILEDVRILVIAGPQNAFTDDELSCLKNMVDRGDSVLVAMSDGGEEHTNTNINFFLEEFGVVVNNGKVLALFKS